MSSRWDGGADASKEPFLGDSEHGESGPDSKYTFSPSKSPHYARTEPNPRGFRAVAAAALTRGGFANSVFVVMNAIMGSGLLALPFAAKSSGIVLFLLLMSVMACCADHAIHLLLTICDRYGVTSYEEVGAKAYGYRGNLAACLAVMLQNLGGMTGDLVIVGDLLPRVMTECFKVGKHSLIANREFLMCLITVVLILPVASLRRIGFIGYSSTVAICLMICFAVAVIVQAFEYTCEDTKHSNQTLISNSTHSDKALTCQYEMFHVGMDTFFVLPTIAFSFVCHTTVLPAYAELKDRSKTKMQRVSHVAIATCWAVYGLTAVFGYLSFGDGERIGTHVIRDDAHGTESNLFDSYADYNPKSYICPLRLLILLSFALIVPLLNFPARKSAIFIMNGGKSCETTWVRFYTITLLYIGLCLVLALFIPNIKDVFGVVGATTSVTLMFLLPGAFYLKLTPGHWRSQAKLPALIHVTFGVIVMLVSLGGIFAKWAGVKA